MSETIAVADAAESSIQSRPHWRWVPLAMLLAALWAWAIAGCTDEWRDDPMYSYGWFVPPLMLFFAWRRLDEPFAGRLPFGEPQLPSAPGIIALLTAILAVFVLPTELFRNELPDDRLNNWGLGMIAVGATLWVARCVGGWRLVLTLAFPVAFFLTAVAWPKRYETPVTIGLQKFVTGVIVEIMHFVGIHAEPRGTTIYLSNGPVGIAEACSGIRSLQASLMISLAIGELFFLRVGRRLLLVVLCALVATILNVGRTLSLCLITEYHGAEAMHKAHDYIGDTILLVLPVLAWGIGRLVAARGGSVPTDPLPRKPSADGTPPPVPYWKRLWTQTRGLSWERMPNFTAALAVGVVAFMTYHLWLAVLDLRDPPQKEPYFTIREGAGTSIVREEMNPDIWATLSPTAGGTFSYREPIVPGGRVELYHFFWKPAAANRWVTGHRPDVCMPAGGWKKDGDVEPVEIEVGGHRLKMHVFRFADADQRVLQVWGIWRNGDPIRMEFFDNPTLEWSLLTGRSRSAVEVISCVVQYRQGQEPIEAARRVLSQVVEYHPATPTAMGARSEAASWLKTAGP